MPAQVTVNGWLYQPSASGLRLGVAATVGADLSMLTVPSASVAELPATSKHVPVTCWPAPSALIVWVTFGACGPLPASAHPHVEVTSVLFQPFAFGAGIVPWNVIVGGVESSWVNVAVIESA